MSRASLVLAVPVFLFAAGCQEEDLGRVAPKIEIGDPVDLEASFCTDEGVRDCSYHFGEVPIGQGRFFKFVIQNPSPVALTLESLSFEPGSDPAFELVTAMPATVGPSKDDYRGEEITVQFKPTVEADVAAVLRIVSDAQNLTEDEDVLIRLTAGGVDLGQPELVITPPACNFGEVGVGVTAYCDITIENIGQRDLEITQVGFTPETSLDVFAAETLVFIPTFVAPGTGLSVRLSANPTTPTTYEGGMTLGTNDPNRPDVVVPMSVTGAEAPTAIARVLSVNGNNVVDAAPAVAPLDVVVLTGEDSTAAAAGDTIVGYEWEIVSRPAESSVRLQNANGMTTGFEFDSGSGTLAGLDVVGTYEVRLTVTDSRGARSANDARVTLNATPQDALHVQLTWDVSSGDLDLHLLQQGADYCDRDSTCYYGNCKPTASNPPDWDGVSGRSPGDPVLDVDDLNGFGPENINVDQPAAFASYIVGVDYYSGSADTWVTVKIFINGGLAYEDNLQFTGGTDFWEVAQVDWNGGGPTVSAINSTARPSGSCLGGF